MKKPILLLFITSLCGTTVFAKGKGKKERNPDAPEINPSQSQIIGKKAKEKYERSENKNTRKSAGYSYDRSHVEFQKSFNFIAEHADQCKFARGGLIAITLGGNQGIQKMYGTAAAVGNIYKMFEDSFDGNVKYAFDSETFVDCTMSKKEAKESDKLLVGSHIFKWSPGVLFAVQTIGQVLDEIGWDKVKVDGIHFTHVNANGSYIERYNLGCDYKAVQHKPLIGNSKMKYYYDIKVDLGNWRTNLDKETIKDCLSAGLTDN